MKAKRRFLSRLAVFAAGAGAATMVLRPRKENDLPAQNRNSADPAALSELRRAVAALDARIARQEASTAAKFDQLEDRVEKQAAQLAEVPSTKDIVSAMEQLLARTMASFDDRLATQAQSIEALKTTVGQTDSLLERVLESIDAVEETAGLNGSSRRVEVKAV